MRESSRRSYRHKIKTVSFRANLAPHADLLFKENIWGNRSAVPSFARFAIGLDERHLGLMSVLLVRAIFQGCAAMHATNGVSSFNPILRFVMGA